MYWLYIRMLLVSVLRAQKQYELSEYMLPQRNQNRKDWFVDLLNWLLRLFLCICYLSCYYMVCFSCQIVGICRTSSCSSLSLFWSPTVQCVALFSLICTVTRTAWMWIKHIQRRSFDEMEFELTIDISISSIQPIT